MVPTKMAAPFLQLLTVLLPSASRVSGYARDTVLPHHTPRDCNCSTWADGAQPGVNKTFATSLWGSPEELLRAGAACAFPANAVSPLPNATHRSYHLTGDGWCLCDGSSRWDDKSWTWCNPPPAVPSQINLLAINATAVGVSFVTADEGQTSSAAASAELRALGSSAVVNVPAGFSTLYTDPGGKRRLSYHHVIISGLQERTQYEYRVQSGGGASVAAVWSPWKRFRSLYSSGITRLAMVSF